jgi:hypothetical protein
MNFEKYSLPRTTIHPSPKSQIHRTHGPQDSPCLPDLLAHGRVDGGKLAAVFDAIID